MLVCLFFKKVQDCNHLIRVDQEGQASTASIRVSSRDRIVVSTLRCGRSNPGSNPGHGTSMQGTSAEVCYTAKAGQCSNRCFFCVV
jgi:hypothetical protein